MCGHVDDNSSAFMWLWAWVLLFVQEKEDVIDEADDKVVKHLRIQSKGDARRVPLTNLPTPKQGDLVGSPRCIWLYQGTTPY